MVCLLATVTGAAAQVDGHVSVMFDTLPDVDDRPGPQPTFELRTSLFVERRQDFGERLRVNLAGWVDGLLAERPAADGVERTAIVRPADVYVEWRASRFDVRAGMSRIVWGRLDEFQPTDVVNPIDLSRFLLEGRSEARLPVALVRGRVFFSGSSQLEAVVVPVFRDSTFDQLAQPSSPFNLSRFAFPVDRREPSVTTANLQGGARFTTTTGRVDWGVSVYRGFRTFPTLTLVPAAPMPSLLETFPRFTMIGGDFETTRGDWGVRGEVAGFVRDELQSEAAARGVAGRSLESGIGIDRRAGDYRIGGNVLWSYRAAGTSMFTDELNGSDVSFVLVADRSFARETRSVRVFGVYDPVDDTTFARVIAGFSLRDNVSLEASGGVFSGASNDVLGRLTKRDFLYTRLKVFF